MSARDQLPTAEKDEGLEARYDVRKINDPTGKHDDCRYFVLDPQHDPIAREALRDYAVHALSYGSLALYQDLDRWLTQLDREVDGSWSCGRCGQAPESHAPGGNADACVYDPAFASVLPPAEHLDSCKGPRGANRCDCGAEQARPTPPEGVTPDGARYAAHLIRKRSRGDRFHPRRPETAAAMLAAADWLDQFATRDIPPGEGRES